MFREMRRKEKALDQDTCIQILKRNTSGVLSVLGDDGYPYSVPLNHVYYNGKLYFHCAKTGHKLDSILKEPKVSYSVVDLEEIIQEKFSTKYRSVILFGKASIIEDETEKMNVFKDIIDTLTPDFKEAGADYIKSDAHKASVVGITIEHMTGKGSK